MKYLFIILFSLLIGCENSNFPSKSKFEYANNYLYKIQIMEIDGCEYLVYDYKNITHKGNCKYCWERKH